MMTNNTMSAVIRRILMSVIGICLSFSVICTTQTYAEDAVNWEEVYRADFSNADTQFQKEGRSSAFEAEISDGKLNVSSNSLCYFTLNSPRFTNDIENINGSDNSVGMELSLRPAGTGITVEKIADRPDLVGPGWENQRGTVDGGASYEYAGKGDSAIYVESVTDINGETLYGLKQFTYINLDRYPKQTDRGSALRTSSSRWKCDADLFEASDNKCTIEIKYLCVDAGNQITVCYPDTSGQEKQYKFIPNILNEWATVKINVSDADFTKRATGEQNSIKIMSSFDKTVYINGVNIKRTAENFSYPQKNKTVSLKAADAPLFGKVLISYDMVLPTDKVYNSYYKYNENCNSMAVEIIGDENLKIGKVLYEMSGGQTDIYLASADNQKELIYSGDISDRNLKYVLTIDGGAKKYSIDIIEGGASILLGATTQVDCIDTNQSVSVLYVNIVHNPYSEALYSCFDDVVVSVKENLELKHCNEDMSAISFESQVVKSDFDLPTVGSVHASAITWESSDSSVIEISSDYTRAIVNRGENDKIVTLTATVVNGESENRKIFEFNVPCISGLFTELSDVTVNGTTAEITVKYCGTTGAKKITFIAMRTTPEGKPIKSYVTTDVPPNKYASLKLSIDISKIKEYNGSDISYHVWDEHNRSLVNNSPFDITELSAEGRASKVCLKWNDCYDDNNAAVYRIYRDNVFLADCSENYYEDKSVNENEEHEYMVVPCDSNENRSGNKGVHAETLSMYSIAPIGKTESEIESHANGLHLVFKEEPQRIAYTEYSDITDADGNVSPCRYAPRGKFMSFYTDKQYISSDDRNVVIIVEYLDKSGQLTLTYNSVIPKGEDDCDVYQQKKINFVTMENTKTWKKAVIVIDDAQFREGSTFSGADFAISCPSDNTLYVRKVSAIRGDLY